MNAEFFDAVADIEKEKGIPREYMYEKIRQAMLTAFRKDTPDCEDNVEVILDEAKKKIEMVVKKTVVARVIDPYVEISEEAAHRISKRAKIGDVVSVPVETKQFGRIAAQAAKQVIIQGIREAERGMIYEEFNSKEHEILTGVVNKIDPRTGCAFLKISSNSDYTEAMLAPAECIRGEVLHEGDRIKVYVVEVRNSTRAPVVVVMGHVDHGKTSLLDRIRRTNVAAGEAGGITQHIGAYRVMVNGKPVTFLDTPGHEAFTSMRARGAMVTDIAILVVAADDGIMPQTIESINHAKAAGIPLVVAINKMDVHGANPDRIKQQLTEYGLVPEEWGGETIVCPISAKTGEGVDKLLENLVLLAEILELKANPNRAARGTVIEARMDKGRGPIMTVLVQNGTLHQGDIIIAGTAVGRVRTMTNDKGQRVTKAGPSIPVEIAGMSEVPSAGDKFNAVADERMARELVEERKQQKKDAANAGSKKVSLDDLFSRIQQGEMKDFNIIVKADVQGSAEAVKSSLEKLSNDEVRVQVIHSGVGAINESDVMLAATSNAIIVGFNVRPDAAARDNAARSNVEIRMYRVIYDCINEIEAAMKGMLAPKFQEQIIGHVEIRQTFKVSKVGTVCGGYVTDGKIVRNSKVRVVRDNIVVFEGDLASLRRFKDDVKEVAAGYECGLQVDKYNDVKVGDVIEVYVMEEIKQ